MHWLHFDMRRLGTRPRWGMMTSSNGNIFRVTGLCAGNSPVPVNSPHKGQFTRSFDVFFDLRLNKRLSKQPWGWWFETPSWSLWRQCNGNNGLDVHRYEEYYISYDFHWNSYKRINFVLPGTSWNVGRDLLKSVCCTAVLHENVIWRFPPIQHPMW